MKHLALVAISVLGFMSRFVHADELTTKPNIIVIIADDLGYGETGMQGNPQIPTPGIDALAASGVRCQCGYVTSSYCSPSRAAIMTGRYQSRFGYDANPTGELNLLESAGLPESETTFFATLQKAGYRTGLMGKWHLGAVPAKRPLKRGFGTFFGFLHEGHYFVPGPPYKDVLTMLRVRSLAAGESRREGDLILSNHTGTREPDYDKNNPILDGDNAVSETEYLTDAITRNAVRFIEEPSKLPFALVVAYNAVHSPMQATLSDVKVLRGIDNPQRRIFAGMLLAMDRGVARIRDAVLRRGVLEDTLIVLLSDNGGPTRELTSSNAPLRGGKGDLYEGGVRVPMLWSMPETIPAGMVESRPVLSVDIAATFLAMANVAPAGPIDGVNVIPFLNGKNQGRIHDRVYWRMSGGKTALRQGDWKLIRSGEKQPFELYHLASDERESMDLAAAEPAILAEMIHAWMSMDSQMIESIVLGAPVEK